MEHYVTLERAIACPRASVAVAAETAAQVLTSAGYRRGLGFGPTSSYVRAYRPAWVTVLAIVGAIPTLGLALLLLRVRSKDHCNVVIEDGPYGVVALVSGRVPAGLPAALEEASGQYVEQQQYQGGYAQQSPPPVLLAPSSGQDGAPFHTPQAILRPAEYPQQGQPQQYQPQQQPPQHQHQPAPQPAPQPYPQPSFDPYPVPQFGGGPGRAPEPEPGPPPAAAPVRPPSRLAPPMPGDSPGREQAAAAHAGANGSPAAAPSGPASDDDPFSSTSGRVPWVGGGRPGPLPAPPGPAPASPISRPPGFPPAAPQPPASPQPAPASAVAASSSASGQAHAAAPARGATAVSDAAQVLRVDTGDVLELGPFCLLGREPVARDGDPQAQLVRFDDPKLSVSKTHMAYGVDSQGIWVMDRNSTNGTTVIDPTGRRIPCTPGNRHYIGPGYQVQIGQRRITVETPGPAA